MYPSRDLTLGGTGDHSNLRGHEVAARAIEKELLADSSYFFDFKAAIGGESPPNHFSLNRRPGAAGSLLGWDGKLGLG